jgi:hypothetical protein
MARFKNMAFWLLCQPSLCRGSTNQELSFLILLIDTVAPGARLLNLQASMTVAVLCQSSLDWYDQTMTSRHWYVDFSKFNFLWLRFTVQSCHRKRKARRALSYYYFSIVLPTKKNFSSQWGVVTKKRESYRASWYCYLDIVIPTKKLFRLPRDMVQFYRFPSPWTVLPHMHFTVVDICSHRITLISNVHTLILIRPRNVSTERETRHGCLCGSGFYKLSRRSVRHSVSCPAISICTDGPSRTSSRKA